MAQGETGSELTSMGAASETGGHPPGTGGPWQGLQDCVHCGLCLSVCPTYLTTGLETASPRGRLWLTRALEEGAMGMNRTFVRHLDQCLGCLACQTACPSGVPYGHILESARQAIETEFDRPAPDRVGRFLLTHLFPHPGRVGRLAGLLHWYQRLGLAGVVRRSGLLARLSPTLAGMEGLLPAVPPRAERRPLPALSPARGTRRARIGLLTGCVQRHFLPEVNRASLRVLTAAGYEVVAPARQGCCGAVHVHLGQMEAGWAQARALIATFEAERVDLVVANAAGCGAQMKEYGHLLRDEPGWRDRGAAFGAAVRDISELLAETAWNGALSPVPLRVAYHEACHLAHAQKIRSQPRHLLSRIPGLHLTELAESDMCCGSAGVYNILQPRLAGQLLQRKVERIRASGAEVVAAGNIGCLLQVRQGLAQAGLATRAVHPVEILDWALNGGRSTEP